MNAQQLHDYIIKPTLQYMGGNYYSRESAFLLLCTAAIESNCGEYIKQINGPALGVFQMEPATLVDIYNNCDAIQKPTNGQGCVLLHRITALELSPDNDRLSDLMVSPMYACAMARLKYAMDANPLPRLTGVADTDLNGFYNYYKRVYNTELGASTYTKWCTEIAANHVMRVEL